MSVSTTPASLADWFTTPLGRYLLAREQAYFDQTVADIFGFHALQIGLPNCPFLTQSRIPARWTLDYDPPAGIVADPNRRSCRTQPTVSQEFGSGLAFGIARKNPLH